MINNNNISNKKNRKNLINSKVTINIIAIVIMVIIAAGITLFYPKIKQLSKEGYLSPYADNNLLRQIDNCSIILYKDALEIQNNKQMTIEEAYINSYDESRVNEENNSGQNRYKNTILYNLKTIFSTRKEKLNYDLRNLEYLVVDKEGNNLISNTENSLADVLKNTEESNEQLKRKYGFYIGVQYDNNGIGQIINYDGPDIVRNCFGENIENTFNNNLIEEYKVDLNSIKNMTFIYGIPKELKYNDLISKTVENAQDNYIKEDVVLMFGFCVVIVLFILCLFVPYKKAEEIVGNKCLFKVPFEINVIIYFISTIILCALGFSVVVATMRGDALNALLKTFIISTLISKIIIGIINVILWAVIIYFILNFVTLLKYILKNGVVNYLKENLLIINLFKYISRKISRFLDYMDHINLTDKSNKVLIKVLGINFIVVSFISLIWFFGIVAAFIYTIILFFIIKKYFDNIKEKFNMLLKAMNRIAEGNLDVEINEDLGVFNPFKDEIKKIQFGFKKAVEEEVKSQRMKTELISNVSHDLKTPLTSIITYIDLLKNETLNEEDRKSYIETLDKKSQRLKFLIEDLFEVSKANSGSIKLNLVNMNIVELIKQIEIELDDKIRNSKLTLKNNFPENKIILNLDSQKTFRIFENLLMNVVKYAMENSRVYIDIAENKEIVEITIKNISGVEIDFTGEEIIERFSRGDKSRNTEGSGLGLAIAKSFVELQGGSFKIEIDGDLFKVVIKFRK